jgi:hypothetical protein
MSSFFFDVPTSLSPGPRVVILPLLFLDDGAFLAFDVFFSLFITLKINAPVSFFSSSVLHYVGCFQKSNVLLPELRGLIRPSPREG